MISIFSKLGSYFKLTLIAGVGIYILWLNNDLTKANKDLVLSKESIATLTKSNELLNETNEKNEKFIRDLQNEMKLKTEVLAKLDSQKRSNDRKYEPTLTLISKSGLSDDGQVSKVLRDTISSLRKMEETK